MPVRLTRAQNVPADQDRLPRDAHLTVQFFKILQVSLFDVAGGAEMVAWNLFRAYRARGHASWLAVGYKRSGDPDVLRSPNDRVLDPWMRIWWRMGRVLLARPGRVSRQLSEVCFDLAEPRRRLLWHLGIEEFGFPGTRRLLQLPPEPVQILHCHNLHGGYFDLRLLPWLSRQVPTLLTLHDAWLLSGHCAHSFSCERWQTGCGHCPDLAIDPAIRRDATAYNWRRKRAIYARSRLYVATPSRWLMEKANRSILAAGVLEARVIPNGVDTRVFRPADRQAARVELDIPQDVSILLFTANTIRQNPWKDYQTMRDAVGLVATRLPCQHPLFIALGEDAPPERIGEAEIRFVPFQKDARVVARYYQAADVYLHAAKADTFPNTVLEALACGTPVVATAVGGIPEQVKGLQLEGSRLAVAGHELNGYSRAEATGLLAPPGDAEGMSDGIVRLLSDVPLRQQLATNAARDARQRFPLDRQVDAYLDWYASILRQNG